MPTDIVPVSCPRCGERQNQMTGGAEAEGREIVCMACRYEFDEAEYRDGLRQAHQEIERRLAGLAGKGST